MQIPQTVLTLIYIKTSPSAYTTYSPNTDIHEYSSQYANTTNCTITNIHKYSFHYSYITH